MNLKKKAKVGKLDQLTESMNFMSKKFQVFRLVAETYRNEKRKEDIKIWNTNA